MCLLLHPRVVILHFHLRHRRDLTLASPIWNDNTGQLKDLSTLKKDNVFHSDSETHLQECRLVQGGRKWTILLSVSFLCIPSHPALSLEHSVFLPKGFLHCGVLTSSGLCCCWSTGVSDIVVSGYTYIIFLYFILLLLFTHQFPFSGHFLDTLPVGTLSMASAVSLGRTVVELPQLSSLQWKRRGDRTPYSIRFLVSRWLYHQTLHQPSTFNDSEPHLNYASFLSIVHLRYCPSTVSIVSLFLSFLFESSLHQRTAFWILLLQPESMAKLYFISPFPDSTLTSKGGVLRFLWFACTISLNRTEIEWQPLLLLDSE